MPLFKSHNTPAPPPPQPSPPPQQSRSLFGRNRNTSDPDPAYNDPNYNNGPYNNSNGNYNNNYNNGNGSGRSGGFFSGRRRSSSGSRDADLSRDPSILAARQKVSDAEASERDADRALGTARAAVREAREHVKMLEREALEE